MAFVPNTIVKLLSVNFENDYKNVVYWDSLSAQQTEMESCVRHTFREFTYQRKDNIIRVPAHIDTLYDCNYVMYLNNNHSNRWFYAFITNMEYVNDKCTHIYIETDVWGTWWDKLTINESFVEREHCSNDAVGSNTFPEGLETGEYIVNGDGVKEDQILNAGNTIFMAVTEYMDDGNFVASKGGSYGGSFSGLKYIHASTVDVAEMIIDNYNNAGKVDAIHAIFMGPSWLNDIDEDQTNIVEASDKAEEWEITIGNAPSTIDGYTPRNKKLLCFPYSYLLLTNQQGGHAIYHNEKFYNTNGIRKFKTYGVLCPGCSIRTMPMNYNNLAINSDEGLSLGKYPTCAWTSDVYTNWITQNAINIGTQAVTSAGAFLGGLVMTGMGNIPMGLGMVGSGLAGAMNAIGQINNRSIIPDQAKGNINSGDVVFGAKQNNFKWIDMSIKAEYARIIDDFFDKYGYKVNRVKVPNMNHRKVWWFVKTIACNINAPIPQEDIARIRKMFDDGVTFWKVHSQVEHYELDNTL